MSKIEKSHTFDQDEALARMQALTTYWKKHDIATEWKDMTCTLKGKFKGMSFEGELVVEANTVRAAVKANLIARKMGSAYVQGKIADYLDPKYTLEALQAR
ncbi:MAG: polyhydroxyalkanoic acid system family protein [Deltaproteobacteria bacterium]|nr:polyhydroxyalkanoic acid system family protein [Deltaproteobacteria bacterium]